MKHFAVGILCCWIINNFGYSQSNISIKEVKIRYVDVEIETPFAIPCDSFEPLFRNSYKEMVILDPMRLAMFYKIIKKQYF